MCTFAIHNVFQSESKVLHYGLQYWLLYALDDICNVFLQLRQGLGAVYIYFILQVAPKKKIWGAKVRRMRGPLNRRFAADDPLLKVLSEPVEAVIGGVGDCTILLKPHSTIFIWIILHELFIEFCKDLQVALCVDRHSTAIFFKTIRSDYCPF